MSGKFCPKCGKEDVDFYKGFCIDCYREEHDFMELAPSQVTMTECSNCGRWRIHGDWKEPSEELMKDMIKEKFENDLHNVDFKIKLSEDKADVKLKGTADRNGLVEVEEDFEVDLKFKRRLCPICRRVKNQDYRVLIQLRKKEEEHDPDKFEEVSNYIENSIRREIDIHDEAMANWKEVKDEGINYYFGFPRVGKNVLQQTISEFDTEMNKSREDAGYDKKRDQKKVRQIYCIRV